MFVEVKGEKLVGGGRSLFGPSNPEYGKMQSEAPYTTKTTTRKLQQQRSREKRKHDGFLWKSVCYPILIANAKSI